MLPAYSYDISYKSKKEHSNADGLSRLLLHLDQSPPANDRVTTFNVGQIQALPLKFEDIKSATRRDPTLSKVIDYMKRGWTKEVPEDVQPYIQCQEMLY